jgi:hypothetical protein
MYFSTTIFSSSGIGESLRLSPDSSRRKEDRKKVRILSKEELKW